MTSEALTIRRVAELAGVSPRTIRFYEAEGLLPPPPRSPSGYRLYDASAVRRLRLVRRARLLGLGLEDIRELADLAFAESCGSFEDRLEVLLERRLADIDRAMRELQALRSELLLLKESLADGQRCDRTCRAEDCDFCRFIDDWSSADVMPSPREEPS